MAKRRCIASFLGHRHISMSEARTIIAMLGPEGCTEAEVRAAVDDFSSDVIDYVDIPATAGGSWTWHIAKFQRLLPFVVSRCAGFRLELESAFIHLPNSKTSPWHLVLYSDEITPGNVLKLQNRRKAACWYLGIVEMMGFLSREEAWLTLGVIRASEVDNCTEATRLSRVPYFGLFSSAATASALLVLPCICWARRVCCISNVISCSRTMR